MSRDFALLMEHLRKNTGEVELDVPSPPISADAATVTRLAQARQAAIRRGDRVAHLYKVESRGAPARKRSDHRPDVTASVTENECRALIAGGARWVGPAVYAPVPKRYVERIRIRNFRCIKEIEFPLTPLHALIGPNDSGKSTILEAFAAISRTSSEAAYEITAISAGHALTRTSAVTLEHPPDVDPKEVPMGVPMEVIDRPWQSPSPALTALVAPVRVLRLDPDAMRQPTNLIAQGSPLEYSLRGQGLAAVYDALLSRRLDVFLEISRRFTALFPSARSIQLTNPSQTTKALGVELSDGSIGADRLSEGMLYWLAFAALPYLQPTPVTLIEEPENGLHPSRIADVLRVLRALSNTSQIIVATHHPLVINELQPDEVTLITRTHERGTIATPLSSTKNFEQRAKAYALGELWLNYADGDLESDLVADLPMPIHS